MVEGFRPCCPWSSAVSSQPAEAPSPRQCGCTSARAAYEATTRDGRCSKGAVWGKGFSRYLYYAGLKGSTSPCTAPWPSLEGDNRYLYNGYSCRPVKLGVLNSPIFQFLLRQAFADDEASTRLLQILLFLLLSTASLMFIPCAVRSSFTLSIHFFGCLPLLLVPSTCPYSATTGSFE